MIIKSQLLVLMLYVFGPIYGGCFSIIPQGISVGRENPCALPPDSGLCHANFSRYFYNTSSNRCESFVYGGCGGNENNFLNQELCQGTCGEPDDSKEQLPRLFSFNLTSSLQALDVCDYPKKVGMCRAGKRRYYFNGATCELFIYGGCRANPNNFRTKEACMEKCGHKLDIGSGEPEADDLVTVPIFIDEGLNVSENTVKPLGKEVEEGNLLTIPFL